VPAHRHRGPALRPASALIWVKGRRMPAAGRGRRTPHGRPARVRICGQKFPRRAAPPNAPASRKRGSCCGGFPDAHGRCAAVSCGWRRAVGRVRGVACVERGSGAQRRRRRQGAADGRAGRLPVRCADDQLRDSRHRVERAPRGRPPARDPAGAGGGFARRRLGTRRPGAVLRRRRAAGAGLQHLQPGFPAGVRRLSAVLSTARPGGGRSGPADARRDPGRSGRPPAGCDGRRRADRGVRDLGAAAADLRRLHAADPSGHRRAAKATTARCR